MSHHHHALQLQQHDQASQGQGGRSAVGGNRSFEVARPGGAQEGIGGTEKNSSDVKEPMSRPGYGSLSLRRPKVVTNTSDIKIKDSEKVWYKYEVVFATTPKALRDGSVRPSREPSKSVFWKIWDAVQRDHQAVFDGVTLSFDGYHAVYANRLLPSNVIKINEIKLAGPGDTTFKVTLQKPIPIPLDSLRNYVANQGVAHFGEVQDSLQALNVIFRHSPSLLFSSTSTSFFNLNGNSTALPGGLTCIRGFFQSVRPCQRGLQLNLDTTSGAFVKSGNFLDLFLEFIQGSQGGRPDLSQLGPRSLPPRAIIELDRLIRGCTVHLDRGVAAPAGKRVGRFKIQGGGGIQQDTARSHTFEVQGQETTVENFFAQTYGCRLRYPNLPLLKLKTGVVVPIELLSVQPGTRWKKRLTPIQQGQAARFQVLRPADRLREILAMRRDVLRNVSEIHALNYGINLASDPTKIDARVLRPPSIGYLGSQRQPLHVVPQDGSWKQQKSRGTVTERFVKPCTEIKSMVVIVPNERAVRDAQSFFQNFLESAEQLGIPIHPIFRARFNDLFFVRPPQDVDGTIASAVNWAQDCFGAQPQAIFWIFERDNDNEYDRFKYVSVTRGIASQALVLAKIRKSSRDFSFHLNCALKLNCKLAGYNFYLDPSTAGNLLAGQKPMVFGADLSHQDGKPSIVALAATMHAAGVLCEEEIALQPLKEPSVGAPDRSRARKQEVIVELDRLVLRLLVRRVFATGAARLPPTTVVFLRDGVSDSEIGAVLNSEVLAVNRAFKLLLETFSDRSSKEHVQLVKSGTDVSTFLESLKVWSKAVKLTFVVCIKRHHVRAVEEPRPGQFNNLSPGTVIDTEIGDARAFDFYLASHKAILGTTRATRYLALHDDNNLSADDLQEFMNSSNHSYQRCLRAVSIPAVVYYADLIAHRVRGFLSADGHYDNQTATSGESTPESRQADLNECLATLETTVAGRDSFRAHGGPPAMWWV